MSGHVDSLTQDERLSWRVTGGIGSAVAVVALFLDQAHKYWMVEVYRIGERGRVAITSYLDLVMTWNPGISYGLLPQDSASGPYLLAGFALVAVAVLAMWMLNAGSRLAALSLGLIIGGALGNIIDRLVHGAVADFFSFHYAGYYWYIFNIADVAIAAGVAGLLLDWVLMSLGNRSGRA